MSGSMDIDVMRAQVRVDLRDPEGERWDDSTLDRHIGRAVRELSLAAPVEATAALETEAGERELSLAALASELAAAGGGIVSIETVEYPAGRYPPEFASFSVWGETLTLRVEASPSAGEPVVVRYCAMHTLDAEGTSIPPALHDLVATGAAAYAALEWANFATNRINSGGDDVWRRYLEWGQDRLASFSRGLAKHGRERRLRSRRLYVPSVAGGGH